MHINQHGRKFPYPSFREYEESSKATILAGQRFTYRDPKSRAERIGYYDPSRGYFTAVTADHTQIVTHYPAPERYVRTLPGSTYS